eukprot:CAMPEP_0113936898 /NCGR_PEP_ID=MMETSP1339-20121228/3649_1 /TAXON_ID=94617 /ORGANISM="Fibrocapsa japonica" /LENGTH=276 /DNA_ID=CAMNT_0000939469 /DNA_START=32 /DNA_END=862 /DNA_ORIENTATION=+ /assembly_acc=CAM_ASM_000762
MGNQQSSDGTTKLAPLNKSIEDWGRYLCHSESKATEKPVAQPLRTRPATETQVAYARYLCGGSSLGQNPRTKGVVTYDAVGGTSPFSLASPGCPISSFGSYLTRGTYLGQVTWRKCAGTGGNSSSHWASYLARGAPQLNWIGGSTKPTAPAAPVEQPSPNYWTSYLARGTGHPMAVKDLEAQPQPQSSKPPSPTPDTPKKGSRASRKKVKAVQSTKGHGKQASITKDDWNSYLAYGTNPEAANVSPKSGKRLGDNPPQEMIPAGEDVPCGRNCAVM